MVFEWARQNEKRFRIIVQNSHQICFVSVWVIDTIDFFNIAKLLLNVWAAVPLKQFVASTKRRPRVDDCAHSVEAPPDLWHQLHLQSSVYGDAACAILCTKSNVATIRK